ncbi:uncharacterized protein MELLADRAFT_94695 [Melampsora larici-populina 98AG31]|uniref:Uncharacterized protein n=1 Tax=Melampsora larici-populina (strain 98AG31 / pathotype 3-4-7) TaxID=747676 RepID=F4S7M3_MELLP|nr:uncharacterized protein MELLADRAFT_94695 [Melampsora larici-populina 98AG31]EGF99345.1 hypothetical protein MELLADRAFT_94695 [Melampsora larici-populina 98AG31]
MSNEKITVWHPRSNIVLKGRYGPQRSVIVITLKKPVRRSYQSTRSNDAITNADSSLPETKRSHNQETHTTSRRGLGSAASANTDANHLPTPSATQQQQPLPIHTEPVQDIQDLDLDDITLKNYHQVKRFWPLRRITDQLQRQKSSNHQLSAEVLVEAKAVLESLETSLHMIAMVSHVDITTLKRALGLVSGTTHANNPWHRWLNFALDANKFPIPTRGHPDSAAILANHNKANHVAYNTLTVNQLTVFKSPVFFALGGYPNYSAISFSDNASGDTSVLIPEVPKLSEEDELRYQLIYDKLVNTKKVAKDCELNTPAACAINDHQMLGIDYYIIACSNNTGGEGWCREHSSQEEIVQWVSDRAQLQHVFPVYCQHGSIVEKVQAVASPKNGTLPAKRPSNNQSYIDKRNLGGQLNELVLNLVGKDDYKPFPRTPNPIASLQERKLKVESATNSALSKDDFDKGFTGMNAKARRSWLSDLKDGKFKLMKEVEVQPSKGKHHITESQSQPSGPPHTTDNQSIASKLQNSQPCASNSQIPQIPQVIEQSGQPSKSQKAELAAEATASATQGTEGEGGATCDLA